MDWHWLGHWNHQAGPLLWNSDVLMISCEVRVSPGSCAQAPHDLHSLSCHPDWSQGEDWAWGEVIRKIYFCNRPPKIHPIFIFFFVLYFFTISNAAFTSRCTIREMCMITAPRGNWSSLDVNCLSNKYCSKLRTLVIPWEGCCYVWKQAEKTRECFILPLSIRVAQPLPVKYECRLNWI